ncbi:MAG: sulfatase-like hydrolase/transferase [Verrucomicrobiales bacterium]
MSRHCSLLCHHAGLLPTAIAAAFLAYSLQPPASSLAAAESQPNFLFILADDLGYGDLGCYGAPDIATPHIDSLARDGLRFTDAYANAPICSPTRLAFVTARYQQRLDLEDALSYQEHTGRGLRKEDSNLPRAVREAGYVTALVGKWHLGYENYRHPNTQGFDHFLGLLGGNHHYFAHMDRIGVHDLFSNREPLHLPGEYSTALLTDDALALLERQAENPFFLYLSYNAPHFPWQGPDDRKKVIEPKSKNWQLGDRATYVAMVEAMDRGIGRVLETLERKGLAENTLVVFTSDNGGHTYSRNAPLAGSKSTLWEGGVRVPCLARWPGVIPRGAETAQPVITFDWATTFLRLAGAPRLPEGEDGVNLSDLLRDPTGIELPERTFFWRMVPGPVRKKTEEGRALRQGKWKLIAIKGAPPLLFDLENDLGETRDLAAEHPELVHELLQEFAAWERDVDD